MRPSVAPLSLVLTILVVALPRIDVQAEEMRICTSLPANLVAHDGYTPLLLDAIGQSRTLMRQCAAIAAAPDVHVVVRLPRAGALQHCRARTMLRHTHQGLRAIVEIPVTGDLPELLAHELEHVIEQIEGIDLRARVAAGDPTVRQVTSGAFETDRAHAAGLAARSEVLAGGWVRPL